ncbi:hypothetical protein BSKO_09098 [Bryopsis sp. KO-2023]|nr:hypothetical protein BSKO_09098 [Bryopsis sp. KO-2023]
MHSCSEPECCKLFSERSSAPQEPFLKPNYQYTGFTLKTQLHNVRASGITQSGMAPKDESGASILHRHIPFGRLNFKERVQSSVVEIVELMWTVASFTILL